MVLPKPFPSAQGGFRHSFTAHQKIVETRLASSQLGVVPSGVNGVPDPIHLDVVPCVLFAVWPVVLVIGPALNVCVRNVCRIQQYLKGSSIAVTHRGGIFAVIAQNTAGGAPGVVGSTHTQRVIHIVLGHPVVQIPQLGHPIPTGHFVNNSLYLFVELGSYSRQCACIKALTEERLSADLRAKSPLAVAGHIPHQLGGINPEIFRVIPEKSEDGSPCWIPRGGDEGDRGGVSAVLCQLFHLSLDSVIGLLIGGG